MAVSFTARRAGPRLRLLVVLGAVVISHLNAQAPQVAVPAPARTDMVLLPGDKVQLKIWREPDLSGEFVVAADGMVVFPKIGRVQVGQLSTDSVQHLLITQYSVSLRDPSIEVTALRRVSVTGSVRNPGFYYADPTVTITGAVALAGGVTSEGNRSRIDLMRGGTRTQINLSNLTAISDSPLRSGDQVSVPERSWFSRNIGLVASAFTGVAIIIAARVHP